MTELEKAVAEFSSKSPDAIAAYMRRRKITGRPGTTGKCPLAKAMQATHTGRYVVGRKYIMRIMGGKAEKVKTPPTLAAFLRKFDLSQYSDLIAPPPRCLTEDSRLARRARPAASGKEKPGYQRPKRKPYTHHWSRNAIR